MASPIPSNRTLWEPSHDSDLSLDNLYGVILQCFVVIALGYLAGRSGLISSSQATGIGSFVSKFSLPALLLKSMIELDFSKVNWMFLVGILIAKGTMFVVVVFFTLLIKRPVNLGFAGIFGIFCTQSNDFAVGYPILQALYGKDHKEYLNYLYLVAPISLVVLNPIGFTLLEVQKIREQRTQTDSSSPSESQLKKAFGRVVKGVLTNPIVLMTFIGIIGHFVFYGKVPGILDDILTVLGSAYNATALFLLGLSMLGKFKGNMGITLLVTILLITAKTLILPLVIWQLVGNLVEACKDMSSLSMYGFIYGTFPAAPSVFLYASSYNVGEDIIARGIVLGTFLSAPLMFGSAKMMTMAMEHMSDHNGLLASARLDISIISIVFSVWVLFVFFFGGKWRLVPHRFTAGLVSSQVVTCVGMVLYHFYGTNASHPLVYYPVVVMLLFGVFASRLWTAILSLVMCLLHTRSLCYVLDKQIWFWFTGFGAPVVLTGVILMVGQGNTLAGSVEPTFYFGTVQAAVSAAVLAICITVTITSMVLWQRIEHRSHAESVSQQYTTGSPTSSHGSFDECDPEKIFNRAARHENPDSPDNCNQQIVRAPSIEDIVPNVSRETHHIDGHLIPDQVVSELVSERTCLTVQCSAAQRRRCVPKLQEYISQTITTVEENGDEFHVQNASSTVSDYYQTSHHLILLLVLLLSMFVGLFLCIWKLSHSEYSGIHLEVEFLDSLLIYGQGIIFLAVFGFDTRLVISPLINRVKSWIHSSEIFEMLKSSQGERERKKVCRQFTKYHKDNFKKDMDSSLSSSDKEPHLFRGTALCNWLIQAGLVEDKNEAVSYGRHLIQGGVIAHLANKYPFQDAQHLYRFVEDDGKFNC